MTDRRLWTPLARRRSRAALTLAELEREVEGPDRRFQDHLPGCDCGNEECPYWRGEEARRRYLSMTPAERRAVDREAAELLAGEPTNWFL